MFRHGETIKRTHDVFGVSNEVLLDSYVDRGELDEEIGQLLERPTHIALRGVSKCGKSWLRQTVLPDAIVIQCRLGKAVLDLYREALGELGVRLEVSTTTQSSLSGKVEASGELGIKLLAKVTGRAGIDSTQGDMTTSAPVSEDINDLRLVAALISASGKRLVIEDFHYLSIDERRKFAFDLKALWDFGVFVIIVGVWSEQNMLIYLNPDLTGRVHEVSIVWTAPDLRKILEKGGTALNLEFSPELKERAISDCHENAGILQKLILGTLDRVGIHEEQKQSTMVEDLAALEHAELFYAEQLNPLYQQFAKRVARGIRVRHNATGIYAHALAVVLSATDEDLIRGISLDRVYEEAHGREARIQKGNLRTVLERLQALQVDDDGRGLVLAYNEANGDVTVVDRQILLYRKYSTVKWPWEDLIREAEDQGELFDEA
jgi:hypothetical protein